MLDHLENPRRAVRARVPCRARVALASGAFYTATEDVGGRGCQVVVPEPLEVGQSLRLELDAPKVRDVLEVEGRVAWLSPRAPWRVGVAFADGDLPLAAEWIERVRAASPELFARHHAPARVSLDAMVYLGQVPRLPDFGADDLAFLRQIGPGLRLHDLPCASANELRTLQRRLFALLEQGSLTLLAEQATHPRSWRAVLGEVAAAPPELELAELEALPELPAVEAPPAAAPRAPDPVAPPRPQAIADGAGGGWRAPARVRSGEAEQLFRQGVAEIEAGRMSRALGFLRQAIALAPGDAEIAGAIGRAMRGG